MFFDFINILPLPNNNERGKRNGPDKRANAESSPEHSNEWSMLMSFISDNIVAPIAQAEPPQWHIYRALVIYRDSHKAECDNIYFKHKLNAAHDAYLNTFAAG